MKKWTILLLAASWLGSFYARAETSLSAQYQCYKSLIGIAKSANFLLTNNTILLPGYKGDKKGFYLYSEKSAYFCKFPAQAQEKYKDRVSYYMKVVAGDNKPVYMNYVDYNNLISPNIAESLDRDMLPGIKTFVSPKCGENLTDETRSLLTSELKVRMKSANENFKKAVKDSKPSVIAEEKKKPSDKDQGRPSSDEPSSKDKIIENIFDRLVSRLVDEKYPNALKVCSKVSDLQELTDEGSNNLRDYTSTKERDSKGPNKPADAAQ